MVGHVPDEVGINLEQTVHVRDIAGTQRRGQDIRISVVAKPPSKPGVVRDVTGGLLEIGHQPAPFEDLGEDVGGLLAGQVHAPQLGHTVVAVFEKDPVVKFFSPPETHRGVDGLVARHV